LGLAICRNLVEAMGGKITIDSVPGKGTRFHVDVIFPAIEGDVGRARLDGRTVVAVDAGEPAMRIAITYLEAAGARVQRVKTLNNLTLHDAGLRSGGDDTPVIIIGPDAEAEDVETATSTLRRTMPNIRLSVLWLHPRALSGALSLARRGVRAVRAHPLRRGELLGAVAGAQANIVDDPTPVLTRRIGGAPLLHGDQDAAAAARADGRVILVAEDNVVNQQVLRQQLAILGFDCDMASSGGAALQALRERSYLLLLCDCHMPGIDGFELTRLIRAQEKESGKHLPIIAVTANAMPGEADRCRAAGMDDYLAKPIEIRGLQGALARWLEEERSPLDVGTTSKKAPMFGGAVITNTHANLKNIDLRNLTAVFGNDPARLKPVLEQWRVVIGDSYADLNRALAASQWEDAIGAAHRIKGSAGIAGAHTLSAAAVALETALRMGDSTAIAREGEHVLACATAALTEVQAWSGTLKVSA
jgi:CheY-like chemotaxis protein/HPt (histidine-containing phosphotransfer) domain-containing protein